MPAAVTRARRSRSMKYRSTTCSHGLKRRATAPTSSCSPAFMRLRASENRNEIRVGAMESKQLKQISKSLSYVLRHRPDSVGIELQAGGWIPVEALLRAFTQAGHPLTA